MDLKDRVAVITGSGRGIGRALAIEFARNGSLVVCCARTDAEIQETAAIIRRDKGRCLPIRADVTDRHQVDAMVAQTIGDLGRIDVLVNNAARIPVIDSVWKVEPELWWDEVTVNLRGPMLCAHAVLPHMMEKDEGIIINMAGGANIPGRTSYCCSKVALSRLTVLLAKELESVGSSVVVFEMGPGLVKTRRTLHEAQSVQGIRWNPSTKQQFELGKDRPPEDCARAAIMLVGRAGPELNGRFFSTGDVIAT